MSRRATPEAVRKSATLLAKELEAEADKLQAEGLGAVAHELRSDARTVESIAFGLLARRRNK